MRRFIDEIGRFVDGFIDDFGGVSLSNQSIQSNHPRNRRLSIGNTVVSEGWA